MPSISTQLLIIGGGSTGLGIAWDACLRGLKVVLVEQGDLGQGTSGRYHGALQSGGRYVISDPVSARDCASENVTLRRITPHAIEDTGGLFVSTPSDPIDYSDRWFNACQAQEIQAEEISLSEAYQLEPALIPEIARAFRVNDASLDSFRLLHSLFSAITQLGGKVWLRHRVENLIQKNDDIIAAKVISLESGETFRIGADLIVNAAGPWAKTISNMAGISIPILLSKGTLVAVANRPIHTIVSRCRPPSNGDIIVPVGTVAVIGTTDVVVRKPSDLTIEAQEIDFLLEQGDQVIPGFSHQRPLRAWAGIRPLYKQEPSAFNETRDLTRTHIILDHSDQDGIDGLLSVFGGKLTTFRLMAEEVVNIVCEKIGVKAECQTSETVISQKATAFYTLSERMDQLASEDQSGTAEVTCECELVTRSMIENSLAASSNVDLDDLRRELRLGMGPCQGGFCAFRAAGIAHEIVQFAPPDGGLAPFLDERWKGNRPLGWGYSLRQMELTHRIYFELFGTHLLSKHGK